MNGINKLKDNLTFRLICMLCCIALIVFRQPDLIKYPRLWAEEGFVFYQFALRHSLYEIYTTAHVGYLTLFNSIVSSIQAKLFSVEYAAIISTYFGFFIQLVPIYIICFTNNRFWNAPLKKILCTLSIIVITAPELWLNTTNSHFILGLTTFLIMVISANELSKFQRYFFRVLLFLGGLTGPASVLFAPAFILKSYREKNKEKYIQAGILSICAAMQASVIVYSILYNNTYRRLSNYNYKNTVYSFFVDNFSILPHTSTSYLNPITFYLGLSFGLMMAILFTYFLIKTKNNTDYFISLISLLIVGIFSTLGSLNMAGSPRYAYIPGCIFIMIIISKAFENEDARNLKLKRVSLLVLIICLAANIAYYRYGMRNVYASNYPKWADEVAKWRIDKNYNPKIHPGTDSGQCVKL